MIIKSFTLLQIANNWPQNRVLSDRYLTAKERASTAVTFEKLKKPQRKPKKP